MTICAKRFTVSNMLEISYVACELTLVVAAHLSKRDFFKLNDFYVLKKEIMKRRSEIATQKLFDGFNCAQAVFYSFCDDLKIDKDIALKLACGFGAGMGRKGEVCGAISGGILVIGSKHGRGEKDDRTATEMSYKKTKTLMDQFAQRHGTVICRQLINGCDLTTPEGQQFFKENELLKKTCAPCVVSVVDIVEEIL